MRNVSNVYGWGQYLSFSVQMVQQLTVGFRFWKKQAPPRKVCRHNGLRIKVLKISQVSQKSHPESGEFTGEFWWMFTPNKHDVEVHGMLKLLGLQIITNFTLGWESSMAHFCGWSSKTSSLNCQLDVNNYSWKDSKNGKLRFLFPPNLSKKWFFGAAHFQVISRFLSAGQERLGPSPCGDAREQFRLCRCFNNMVLTCFKTV